MRVFMTLCVALLLAGAAAADEVYVPDNQPAAGSTNVIPWQASFMSTDCRYQAFYTCTQLGGGGYLVKEISFATDWTGNFKATQLQIRLSHTTATSLDATLDNNIPAPFTVYNGPITWNTTSGVWTPIGLTGTFLYNGVDNVVLDIRYIAGTNSTSSGTAGGCRYTRGAIPRNWAYGNYNATVRSGTDLNAGLKTRFTVDRISLSASGKPAPGSTVTFLLSAPGDAGLPYQLGTSLGMGPIPIDTRTLNLSLDDVLVASVGGKLPAIFQDYGGTLDASGAAQGKLNLPAIPVLVGIRLHTAFLTLKAPAPSGVQSVSQTASFTITP
ncbi:MAG: hypothetical protein JXQ29_17845 [Planctomycetes bacterium]|nr:hypothetical protein [Planctomycetota bacterium]